MVRNPKDHFTGSHYETRSASGPVSFLNPTQRYFAVYGPVAKTSQEHGVSKPGNTGVIDDSGAPDSATTPSEAPPKGVYNVWRSRDNRKGRHPVVVSHDFAKNAGAAFPGPTNTLLETWSGIRRMFMRFPWWDVSYDVAVVFTLGSVIWVINGFFVWLPFAAPSTEFPNESDMGGGLTAFIGATVFEFGSVLLMLEAVNENRSYCFGWALEEAWESGVAIISPTHDSCRHHHKNRRSFLNSPREASNCTTDDEVPSSSEARSNAVKRKWAWWPSYHELSTHYFRDIGFLACFSQMIGATVFWISGFTGLPPIYNALSVPAANGVFWLPQVIGGTGFIISSLLFMIEVQEKWYIPAPSILGWYIGLFNLIGAIGFTLCGALGFAIDKTGVEYASTLSTFIGSWAFLIGSVVQWFESLDKYPISVGEEAHQLVDRATA